MSNFFTGFLAKGNGSSSFVEINYPGYARQPVTFGPMANGETGNVNPVTFTASAPWLPVTQDALFDENGNALLWWPTTNSVTLGAGQSINIAPGGIQIFFAALAIPNLNTLQIAPGSSPAIKPGGLAVTALTALQIANGSLSLWASIPKTSLSVLATAQQAVADGVGNETVNTTLNSRIPHWAPQNASLTDIVIGIPGFSFNGPEVDWPNGFTATAAIEYPASTFTPVYASDTGSRTLTVNAGRTMAKFAPCSTLVIPAGAQFFVKAFCSWSVGGFYGASAVAGLTGAQTKYGVGLADQTLITISGGSNGVSGGAFSPVVYGRLSSPAVVLGILGTSHDRGTGDTPDPNSGGAYAWGRAMRGAIPASTVAHVGQTLSSYLTRMDGAHLVFKDAITHLLFDMVTNDIYASASLATLQASIPTAIAPFLARGVKVYSATVTPRTTSTDNWLTVANQTISNTAQDTVRLAFNAWLRANWQSIGLSGIFDFCHAIDPNDTSLWGVDPGAVATSANPVPRAWATLTGGVVTAMPLAFGTGSATFPVSSTIPCITRNMPGDTNGSGAVVTATTNGSGVVTSWNIVSGGSGYKYPPLIHPVTKWTHDGIHLSGAAYDTAIVATGICPEMFTL